MCVFKGILAYLVSGPKSTPDFPGLILVFVEIMPDKVSLDHKNSYSILKFFIFVIFSLMDNFLIKIKKKEIFKTDQI